jgi:hypothetical protein
MPLLPRRKSIGFALFSSALMVLRYMLERLPAWHILWLAVVDAYYILPCVEVPALRAVPQSPSLSSYYLLFYLRPLPTMLPCTLRVAHRVSLEGI